MKILHLGNIKQEMGLKFLFGLKQVQGPLYYAACYTWAKDSNLIWSL